MRKLWIIVIGVIAVVAVGGAALWYFALRSDAPERFTIEPTTPSSGSPSTTTPLTGSWTVGRSADGKPSEAGYRVSERFASGALDVDAVGRTTDVTGTMTATGTAVTAADITVNVATLKSDRSQRDNKLRTTGLETDRFPTATFTLTQPIELGAATGIVKTTATGTLTLHGVTKPVTIPIEATRTGEVITVVGAAPIVMADYGITPPSIAGFVSVADNGTLEMQVFFVRA